ncbi:hypothetical protein MRB53_025098 [Persea americana]|uniref:Uncharacterized protein n=1 Tax=Persea americana TaxID=3435 RepID=A0ACC2LET6_PERAE|nr:hypothetical protein MRB53_025098 [Persea americana]
MARPLKLIWALLLILVLSTPTFSQLDEIYYAGFSDIGTSPTSPSPMLSYVTVRSLDLSSLSSLPHHKKKHISFIVAASTSAALLMFICIAAAIYIFQKIKKLDVIEPWELKYGPQRFSYKELKTATKGFHNKELLGFGGFGRVYRGTLPKPKTQIAIKRVSHESRQGIREFVAEIASTVATSSSCRAGAAAEAV